MERPIDFFRDRNMLCDNCGKCFVAKLEWYESWDAYGEDCPYCGVEFKEEKALKTVVAPTDPMLEKAMVAQCFWYHTTTCQDWPPEDCDQTEKISPINALHVGTYEAAVHNMLRRMASQSDGQSEFYLCRVRLRPRVVVRDDIPIDPSDYLGNVALEKICPPGIDVSRYLNLKEDQGGISLALGRNAIKSVQQVALPIRGIVSRDWVCDAIATLEALSDEPVLTTNKSGHDQPEPSLRTSKAEELEDELADRLPVNFREQFKTAMSHAGGDDPSALVTRMAGLVGLIEEPHLVLAALDSEAPHEL